MLELVDINYSLDGSELYTIKQKRTGLTFDIVYVQQEGKEDNHSLCVSAQIGCRMACKFCSTGQMKICHNLTGEEMYQAVMIVLKRRPELFKKLDVVAFMGMGEPLENFENVCIACNLIKKEIRQCEISISTVGIANRIREFAERGIDIKLYYSLHFPFEEERKLYMPGGARYCIDNALDDFCYYYKHNPSRKIRISYLLLKGINSDKEHIDKMLSLLDRDIFKIILIDYNESDKLPYRKLGNEEFFEILSYIAEKGFEIDYRKSKATDIAGGCGQLIGKNNF